MWFAAMKPHSNSGGATLALVLTLFVSTQAEAQEGSACVDYCRAILRMGQAFDVPLSNRDSEIDCGRIVSEEGANPADVINFFNWPEAEAECIGKTQALPAGRSAETRSAFDRVSNGAPASKKFWEQTARIRYTGRRGPEVCTGVFLGTSHVLTAGHCSCGESGSYVLELQNGSTFADGRESLPLAGDVVRFPGYKCTPNMDDQPGLDLAILPVKITFENIRQPSDKPRAISMFDIESRDPVPQLAITGYGNTEELTLPDHLRVGFGAVGDPFCRWGSFKGSICAMFREFALISGNNAGRGVDSCGGDSGGPVFAMRQEPSGEAAPVLVGITSRGLRGVRQGFGRECGGGGIYTAVATHSVLGWLTGQGIEVEVLGLD
jgi:Trypsin